MKKTVIILFLLCISLFCINSAYAMPELSFQNQSYQPGETLIGNITGEFAQKISLSQVEFYEGRKQVFIEYDLTSYNNIYYFYAYLNREGNFSLKVNNILYKEDEKLKSVTLEKEINVKKNPELILLGNESGNETYEIINKILSVKPGFVFSSNKAKLTLYNKGDTDLNISYLDIEKILSAGDLINVEFTPNESFSYFIIKSYKEFSMPIIYVPLGEKNISKNLDAKLKADPRYLLVNLASGEEKEEHIELFNFGDTNISNISINTNISFAEIEEIENINAKSVLNLTLKFYTDEQGIFQGVIFISYMQDIKTQNLEIPLIIYSFPENTAEGERVLNEKTAMSLMELCAVICRIVQENKLFQQIVIFAV